MSCSRSWTGKGRIITQYSVEKMIKEQVSNNKLAVFRTDASVKLGSGHIVRCLSLADALSSDGWLCQFAVSQETLRVFPALLNTDHSVLSVDCNEEEEPGFIEKSLEQACALL